MTGFRAQDWCVRGCSVLKPNDTAEPIKVMGASRESALRVSATQLRLQKLKRLRTATTATRAPPHPSQRRCTAVSRPRSRNAVPMNSNLPSIDGCIQVSCALLAGTLAVHTPQNAPSHAGAPDPSRAAHAQPPKSPRAPWRAAGTIAQPGHCDWYPGAQLARRQPAARPSTSPARAGCHDDDLDSLVDALNGASEADWGAQVVARSGAAASTDAQSSASSDSGASALAASAADSMQRRLSGSEGSDTPPSREYAHVDRSRVHPRSPWSAPSVSPRADAASPKRGAALQRHATARSAEREPLTCLQNGFIPPAPAPRGCQASQPAAGKASATPLLACASAGENTSLEDAHPAVHTRPSQVCAPPEARAVGPDDRSCRADCQPDARLRIATARTPGRDAKWCPVARSAGDPRGSAAAGTGPHGCVDFAVSFCASAPAPICTQQPAVARQRITGRATVQDRATAATHCLRCTCCWRQRGLAQQCRAKRHTSTGWHADQHRRNGQRRAPTSVHGVWHAHRAATTATPHRCHASDVAKRCFAAGCAQQLAAVCNREKLGARKRRAAQQRHQADEYARARRSFVALASSVCGRRDSATGACLLADTSCSRAAARDAAGS